METGHEKLTPWQIYVFAWYHSHIATWGPFFAPGKLRTVPVNKTNRRFDYIFYSFHTMLHQWVYYYTHVTFLYTILGHFQTLNGHISDKIQYFFMKFSGIICHYMCLLIAIQMINFIQEPNYSTQLSYFQCFVPRYCELPPKAIKGWFWRSVVPYD